MITSIGIRDFQSIESLSARCGPITVFYGESDAGKSAIVRALYGMAFNDWPSDHVTSGRSVSQVVLEVDGLRIGAKKGAGANGYVLEGESREEFNRVGRDVPAPVAEVLGWRDIELDDGSRLRPNFGMQFDEQFLLAASPIKAAKVLGGLTNIAVLYAAIRQGSNEERSARRSAEEAEARAAEFSSEVASAEEALLGAQDRLERRRGAYGRISAAYEQLAVLQALAEGLAAAREDRTAAVAALGAISVPVVPGGFTDAYKRIHGLKALAEEWRTADEQVDRLGRALAVDAGVLKSSEEDLAGFREEVALCPICERPWATSTS